MFVPGFDLSLKFYSFCHTLIWLKFWTCCSHSSVTRRCTFISRWDQSHPVNKGIPDHQFIKSFMYFPDEIQLHLAKLWWGFTAKILYVHRVKHLHNSIVNFSAHHSCICYPFWLHDDVKPYPNSSVHFRHYMWVEW